MEIMIDEIWRWLGEEQQLKNGASNKQVIEKFGKEYVKPWKLLKRRGSKVSDGMFYEDGKWFRWHKN